MNATNSDLPYTTANASSSTCVIDSEVGNTWKPNDDRSIFVTVGTTSFDELIAVFNSAALQQSIVELGYRKIVFQIGRGLVVPYSSNGALQFDHFSFCSDFHQRIRQSALVVSHAGAGTCLEVCRAGRRLVVVVNDGLMHNHQTELADKLSQRRHCLQCVCDDLPMLFQRNADVLRADVAFGDAFVRFDSDYYRNVTMAIEAMFWMVQSLFIDCLITVMSVFPGLLSTDSGVIMCGWHWPLSVVTTRDAILKADSHLGISITPSSPLLLHTSTPTLSREFT